VAGKSFAVTQQYDPFETTNGIIITIKLSAENLASIRSIDGLAENVDSTFITFGTGLVKDTASPANIIAAVTDGSGKKATQFFNDVGKPTLQDFSLDLTTGIIALTFDEPMEPVTSPTGITLQKSSDISTVPVSFTLTGGAHSVVAQSPTIVLVTLSSDDQKSLKLLILSGGLASSLATTFISFAADTFKDTALNGNVAVTNTSGKAATAYFADTSRTALIGVEISRLIFLS
jgi:hypothetical protein